MNMPRGWVRRRRERIAFGLLFGLLLQAFLPIVGLPAQVAVRDQFGQLVICSADGWRTVAGDPADSPSQGVALPHCPACLLPHHDGLGLPPAAPALPIPAMLQLAAGTVQTAWRLAGPVAGLPRARAPPVLV